MKKWFKIKSSIIFFLLFSICIVNLWHCSKSPSNLEASQNSYQAQVLDSSLPFQWQLKPGLQIKLKTVFRPELQKWLWIESAKPGEALSFFWVEGDGTNPSFFSNSDQDTRPRGRVTLPNWDQNTPLWLPSFWPAAELFLANSSGLWLSPRQFEELLSKKKTIWTAPWLQGALPEGSDYQPVLTLALKKLLQSTIEKNSESKAAESLLLIDKSKKHPLLTRGIEKQVEVILAEDSWAQYTILKDPQNPLVLKVEFAPHLDIGQTLFSPLPWVKAALDYEVIEVDFPARP